MSPQRIVEPLDEVEHISTCFVARSVATTIRALDLQRREEAFHGGVIPAVAATTHAASHTMRIEQPLEVLARVLAALVGVMQQLARCTAAPDGQQQCVHD